MHNPAGTIEREGKTGQTNKTEEVAWWCDRMRDVLCNRGPMNKQRCLRNRCLVHRDRTGQQRQTDRPTGVPARENIITGAGGSYYTGTQNR